MRDGSQQLAYRSGNFSPAGARHRGHFFIIGLVVLAVAALCLPAAAQNTVTGAFQGRVTGLADGQPVRGAKVTITNDSSQVRYELTTDSRGEFFQGLLIPGTYRITVEAPSFKPQALLMPLNITKTGEVVPVPVELEPLPPGTSAPTPPPPAEPGVRTEINTTDGRRDGSFDDREIATLPLGSTTSTRTPDELGLLLPGVAPPPQTIGDVAGPGVGPGVGSAGQFSVNGLRSRANNFTVDGSDNNDEDIGVRRQGFVALTSQPVESIQEFHMITLLAPAQFGRNIGAQVDLVSKAGGDTLHGTLYGYFNSDRLNARNFFDTENGNDTTPLLSESGRMVLRDNNALRVTNQSGGKDPFTAIQTGATIGGPIRRERLFYFLSGEYQKINANQEKSFSVPTVDQRGAFRTGASGISRNVFGGQTLRQYPTSNFGNQIFSLIPFPNNPGGVYGANTFTEELPASGRGVIFSARLDDNFGVGDRRQSVTARYNFTDDRRYIPAVDDAIFSTVRPKTRTHNLSIFLNSDLSGAASSSQLFNQFRFSYGRSRLEFGEYRDRTFMLNSRFAGTPFLLNAPYLLNTTLPQSSNVTYITNPDPGTVEDQLGPVGQVKIAGFSPLGVDVFNFPQTRVNKTLQFADELTWRVSKQNFAIGADIRRTDLDSDLPRLSRPLFTFNGGPRLIPNGSPGCMAPNTQEYCFVPFSDPNRVIRPEDLVSLGGASSAILTLFVDRPDSKANLRYYQLNFYGQDVWRPSPELSLSFGLRYEYNSPVREANGLIEQTFSDPRVGLLARGLGRYIDGRKRLYEPDFNNFGPRFGIAYSHDFWTHRTTVIRGGYGIFYDQVLGAVVNQSRNVFPTFLTLNFGGLSPFGQQELEIVNPANHKFNNIPLTAANTVNVFNGQQMDFNTFLQRLPSTFPSAISATLPDRYLESPMAHHYSFVIEQQLSRDLAASVGYIGTTGTHLLRFTSPNLGPGIIIGPSGFESDTGSSTIAEGFVILPARAERSVGSVDRFETTASSRYDSLQADLRGRFSNRFNFQLSYVFSKAEDDVSDVFDLAGAFALPQDSVTFQGERAAANFDVRHRFFYYFSYDFEPHEGNRLLHAITNNLRVAGTGRFHTGQPFTVNSIVDVNLDGNLTDRPNTIDGIEVTGDGSQPVRLRDGIDPFSLLAPFGRNGSVPRNSFRAGKVLDLDLSVIKQFVLGQQRLSFRIDIFNFIDRANFGVPVRLLEAPGFGRATSTITPGRRVQFALKYEF